MPERRAPGVNVEELPTGVRTIDGVSMSTVAFIGVGARRADPVLISNLAEFRRTLGADVGGFLPLAVRGFFENGGTRCYVAVTSPSATIDAALSDLRRERFSMLCCPDEHECADATAKMVAYCEERKDVICLLQSPRPPVTAESHVPPVRSRYAAYYYPWLAVPSLDGRSTVLVPPAGHVCGLYARTDAERGVHCAPAGVRVLGVDHVSHDITSAECDVLVARGVNVIRTFPDKGVVVWSARTTSLDTEWHYINVRRLLAFVEESIATGTRWVVFEPNGPVLWATISRAIHDFLMNLWTSGALVGSRPQSAFFVRCDRTTRLPVPARPQEGHDYLRRGERVPTRHRGGAGTCKMIHPGCNLCRVLKRQR
jgi:Bacteriophage tail sheath protein